MTQIYYKALKLAFKTRQAQTATNIYGEVRVARMGLGGGYKRFGN